MNTRLHDVGPLGTTARRLLAIGVVTFAPGPFQEVGAQGGCWYEYQECGTYYCNPFSPWPELRGARGGQRLCCPTEAGIVCNDWSQGSCCSSA